MLCTAFGFLIQLSIDTTKGDTAWGAYHSMYDTNGWQETVDPDWMLAEDIARYTGVLTMKLLDSRVIPLSLDSLANTMTEWYRNNLMDATTEYGCDPNQVLGVNVTANMMESLEEFARIAAILWGDIQELTERIEDGHMDDEDTDLVGYYNELLGSISKEFMHAEGLPRRTWHKNILWNTAIEDGPSHVYPHIWYALQYQCTEEMMREAFNVTQSLIDGAIVTMQMYMGNVTES